MSTSPQLEIPPSTSRQKPAS